MKWFQSLKLTVKVALMVLLAVFGFLAWNFVDDFFSADDEKRAELSENQSEAAIESGRTAVNTITEQHTREIERYHTVETIVEEVRSVEGIDAKHDIGARGLCDNFGVCNSDQVQRTDP